MVVNKLLLSFQISDNHFPQQMGKMVKLGSGSQREIQDYALSRYACYLIVQNADPSKSVIANGQTIEELGGTMPEDLLTPEEDLKKLKRRVKSAEKKMIKKNQLPKKLEEENG